MAEQWALQITEADHEANEFRTLGGAAWSSRAERDAAFAAIPESQTSDLATDPFTWVVDVLDADGFSIVTDRVVDVETVLVLLGEASIEDVRARAIEREAVATEMASSFVAGLGG